MTRRSFNHVTPVLGKNAFVDDTAVVTGDITIGDDSSIWPLCSLRGDLLPIKIGNSSNIQDGTIVHTTHESEYQEGSVVNVGDFVTVGHQAILHGCTIHNYVLIGMGAIIMDNVVVEKHVIVGAGSVVSPNKVLESGFVWRGNPVRKARELTEQEIAFLEYSAKRYVELKDQHMLHSSINSSQDRL